MLMGGKARKYWKVEKIHEQFGIFQNAFGISPSMSKKKLQFL